MSDNYQLYAKYLMFFSLKHQLF